MSNRLNRVPYEDRFVLSLADLLQANPLREQAAIVMGTVVGIAFWFLHKAYFVRVYWDLVPHAKVEIPFVPPGYDWLFLTINIVFAVAHGAAIGFVTASSARHHVYLVASVALLATFAAKFFWGSLPGSLAYLLSPFRDRNDFFTIGLFIVIYFLSVFGSVSVVQWFKRIGRAIFSRLRPTL